MLVNDGNFLQRGRRDWWQHRRTSTAGSECKVYTRKEDIFKKWERGLYFRLRSEMFI